MKYLKSHLTILLIFLISIYSCTKNDNTNSRDDFLGNYIGEATNSMGSWSIANFVIIESSKGENSVLIDGVARQADVEGYVIDKNIYFDEQSFQVDYYSPGGAHVKYTAIYTGSGEFNTKDKSIRIEHTEKQVFDDTTYTIEWITVGEKQ